MKGRLNKSTWLKGAASISLLSWLFYSIDMKNMLTVLKNADLRWLFGGIIWIIAAMLVSNAKWQMLLKTMGIRLPWIFSWNTYWVGIYFNNFLPSSIGGDAMRIHLASKAAGKMGGVSASILLERVLAAAGLAVLGLMMLPFVTYRHPAITFLFLCLIIISLLVVLMITSPKFSSLFLKISPHKSDKLKKFFDSFLNCGRLVKHKPAVILWVIGWSVLFQVCIVMVNYCIFKALHLEQISLLNLMYLIPVTSAAAMLPISINGYGVRESSYVFLLAFLNIDKAYAVSSSLIFAVLVSLLSLYGGWIWLKGNRAVPIAKKLSTSLE